MEIRQSRYAIVWDTQNVEVTDGFIYSSVLYGKVWENFFVELWDTLYVKVWDCHQSINREPFSYIIRTWH
jgi:hypothetical protein